MQLLQNYDWPGNVRELQNVLERVAIVSHNGPLLLENVLSGHVHAHPSGRKDLAVDLRTPEKDLSEREIISAEEWKRREKQNIIVALRQTGGRISGPHGAARLLGIKPTTLASRMKALGIKKKWEL